MKKMYIHNTTFMKGRSVKGLKEMEHGKKYNKGNEMWWKSDRGMCDVKGRSEKRK